MYFLKRDYAYFLHLFLLSGRTLEVVLSGLELGVDYMSRIWFRGSDPRSFRSYVFFLVIERMGEGGAW